MTEREWTPEYRADVARRLDEAHLAGIGDRRDAARRLDVLICHTCGHTIPVAPRDDDHGPSAAQTLRRHCVVVHRRPATTDERTPIRGRHHDNDERQ